MLMVETNPIVTGRVTATHLRTWRGRTSGTSGCVTSAGVRIKSMESERDEYINEVPMVYAKDALTDTEDMRRRMIAAAAAKRMGV